MALTTKQILAARDDWKEWGARFGWSLRALGDTFNDERALANFRRDADGDNGRSFDITRSMRTDIDRVVAASLATTSFV